jgi:hypothetical protein
LPLLQPRASATRRSHRSRLGGIGFPSLLRHRGIAAVEWTCEADTASRAIYPGRPDGCGAMAAQDGARQKGETARDLGARWLMGLADGG